MKVSELLRVMASMLDATEQQPAQSNAQAPVVVNVITNSDQSAPVEQPATNSPHLLEPVQVNNTENDSTGVFVPPLQQKIELLKKSVGMDSVFDADQEDEIQKLRRAAGIKNTLAQQEAADDEPLDV